MGKANYRAAGGRRKVGVLPFTVQILWSTAHDRAGTAETGAAGVFHRG